MARIRSVKPDFFRSPRILKLPYEARWLFEGMWTECDDKGRMPCSTVQLQGLFFPTDKRATVRRVEGWVQLLAKERLIFLYEVEGVRYLSVRSWEEHQRINKPQPPKYPPPPPDTLFDGFGQPAGNGGTKGSAQAAYIKEEADTSGTDSRTRSGTNSGNRSGTHSDRKGKEGIGLDQDQDLDLGATESEQGLQSEPASTVRGDETILDDQGQEAVSLLVSHGKSHDGAVEMVQAIGAEEVLRRMDFR